MSIGVKCGITGEKTGHYIVKSLTARHRETGTKSYDFIPYGN